MSVRDLGLTKFRPAESEVVSQRAQIQIDPRKMLPDNFGISREVKKALLNGDPHWEKIQTQLAILPVEALQASRQIRSVECSEQ
jgi:hypothetical protein